MAYLGQEYVIEDLPVGAGFDPIPAGWYTVKIVEAKLKDTKSGTGQYIAVRYDVLGPQYQGRVVFGNINIKNQNPQAEEIGRQQLGDLSRSNRSRQGVGHRPADRRRGADKSICPETGGVRRQQRRTGVQGRGRHDLCVPSPRSPAQNPAPGDERRNRPLGEEMKLPEPENSIAALIDRAVEGNREEARPHLGASLGHPCDRWWLADLPMGCDRAVSRTILRLFARGQREEEPYTAIGEH